MEVVGQVAGHRAADVGLVLPDEDLRGGRLERELVAAAVVAEVEQLVEGLVERGEIGVSRETKTRPPPGNWAAASGRPVSGLRRPGAVLAEQAVASGRPVSGLRRPGAVLAEQAVASE